MSSNRDLVGIHIWAYEIGEGGVEEWREPHDEDLTVHSNQSVRTNVNFSVEISYKNTDSGDTNTESFIIPNGWVYDGASIPEIFWSMIGKPTDEDFLIPAMVHDWLYGIRYNRELSDEIFKELLDLDGVSQPKATLMWSAVRVFGHVYYASHTSNFWKTIKELL